MAEWPPVKISIVVPAFNEEKLLAESLRRMNVAREAFAERGWESELVVCDNNSTDRTAELARAAGARVVFEPVNQIGRARNTGAAAATGDWLVFIDADSHPSPDLFRELADRLDQGRWIGGGAYVVMDPALHWFWRFWVRLWNMLARITRWAPGSFVVCQTDAFRQLGGFNLRLYAGEEVEFSQRLKRLARLQGKRLFMLRRHPLLTSARKVTLYSRKELLRVMWRSFTSPIQFTSNPKNCHIWYDGRR